MKRVINIFAILGVVSLTALMTGCGGDDDDDNAIPQTTAFAPTSFANQGVTLAENDQSRDLQFATSGDTFTQFQNGTTNAVGSGTYQYTRQGDNAGQLILTTTGEDGTTSQVTYNLAFTSATAGTYTFTTSGGQTGSGTFSNLHAISGGGDNGGGNNGGGDNGGGDNGGGNTGDIPTSLTGRVIDFTATGQGNERLTFSSSGNTVTSDAVNPPNNVGTYTFTPGTGGAPGVLVVTFPNGDTYNLQMNFSDAAHGTWSGSQRFDNADHPVPGGSSFTIQP